MSDEIKTIKFEWKGDPGFERLRDDISSVLFQPALRSMLSRADALFLARQLADWARDYTQKEIADAKKGMKK